MSLESAAFINGLVATNPLSSDSRSEGDDHIRLLKATLLATFPNITGAVTPTHTELNHVVGVTSGIQAQLNSKPPLEIGTVCLFWQAAAPTGWTKITTQDNKALRVVSGGTGGGAAGSQPFTTAFASQTPAGTVGNTALTAAQIPAHVHTYLRAVTGSGNGLGGSAPFISVGNVTDSSTGTGLNGDTHTHTFTGTAMNLAVQYIDIILASRTT